MKNPVNIKGTNSGMIIVLDKNYSFNELKTALKEKIIASASFFGNASIAISFEGRLLSDAEKYEMSSIISENSDLNVVCISDNDPNTEAKMRHSLQENLKEIEKNTGFFYKGEIESGQNVNFESSVIILGDVEEGAQVVSKGSIVVIGTLSGFAYAGAGGKKNVFIAALNMNPTQLRIADVIAKPPEKKSFFKKNKDWQPKIAYLENDNIYVDFASKDIIKDIKL